MAVKTFDSIYAQLSADERKLLDNVFAKEPELKDGWLRQDDYSRKQTEFASKKKEYDDAVEYKTRMEPWSDQAYERIKKLEAAGVLDADGNELWTAQKAELERKAAAAALSGDDMTPEQIDAKVREIIKAAGVPVTAEERAALYASEAKTLVEAGFKERETKFNTDTIPFVAGFSAAVAVVANRYEKESGESWNADKQKELFGLMSSKQNFDPFAVQEEMLAPIKAKKQREEDIEAEVKRRLGERGMPGAGHEDFIPQSESKGALQIALERSAAAGSDFEATIKAQAVKAAQELRTAGKV